MAKSGNRALGEAKRQKKDEFYTQLGDINAELGHYTRHFKGKVVFCNCDDPYESNFFKYFAANFNALGLKRLIATCYAGSPVAGRQLELNFGSGFNAETQSRRGCQSPFTTLKKPLIIFSCPKFTTKPSLRCIRRR